MPVDMKHTIAKAVEKLLLEKKTVKYSYFKKIEKSSYYDEIEKICFSHFTKLFTHIAQENEFFNRLDDFDQELFVRYHCYALAGILRGWNEKNSIEELDRTLHDCYLFLSGEFWQSQRTKQVDSPVSSRKA